jgi:hypothetical protein
MITKFLDFIDIRGKEQYEKQDLYIVNYGDNKYLYLTERKNNISYIGIKLKDKNYYDILVTLLDIIYSKYKTDDYIYFSIENLKAKLDLEDVNYFINYLK